MYVCMYFYCIHTSPPFLHLTHFNLLPHFYFSAVASTSAITPGPSTSGIAIGTRMRLCSDSDSDADLPDTLPYSGIDE